MSKKSNKQKKKKNTLLIPLIAGGILLLLAALTFAFGGSNTDSGLTNGGTPRLTVDQEKIDYGDVHFGVNKTFAIKVTNTGDGVLRFKEKPYVQVLEGC
ncbi:MAG: hypothetical protein OHK0031_02080 [Anaerolineales bacterium]